MRFIGLISLLLFAMSTAQALTCTPVKLPVENKNLILSSKEDGSAQLYFFKNIGTQGVWIDHPTSKSMTAGWSSYLQKDHWSVFLLNRKNFTMNCALIQPGNVRYLDCNHVVSVCTPKELGFKKTPKGSYWLAEDESWDDVVKTVEKRGVILKK